MSVQGFPIQNIAVTGWSPERNDTHLVSSGVELQGSWLWLTPQENWGMCLTIFILRIWHRSSSESFRWPFKIKEENCDIQYVDNTRNLQKISNKEVCWYKKNRSSENRCVYEKDSQEGLSEDEEKQWEVPPNVSAKMASWRFKVHHSQRNTSYAQNPSKTPSLNCTCHINPLNYVIVIILQKPPDVENEITPILQCQEHHKIA